MMSDARLRLPLLILTAVLVHTTVASRVRILGVMPEVMLLVAIAAGMAAGATQGAVVGFGAGLAADVFLATPFGLSALVYCVIGYAVGAAHSGVLANSKVVPAVTGLVASAVGVVLFAIVDAILGRPVGLAHLVTVAAVVGVVNALLAPLAVRLVGWALGRSPSLIR